MFRFFLIFAFGSLLLLTLSAFAYPNGAPTKACHGLVPSRKGHKADPSKKPSPYALSTELLDKSLKLKVSGVPPFRGFAMQVRRVNDSSLAGEFSWDQETTENVKYMKCDPENPKSSITHSKSRAREELVVYWTWPDDNSTPSDRDYQLIYTVVTNRKHFWVKTTSLIFPPKIILSKL